jgi:predicted nucleotidyltransferase
MHHIKVPEWNKEYDVTIYSIVKFFQLCMENNPNMVDSLFLPRRCVLHSTAIYEHVRDNRRLFLHKGSWHKFRGYAYSQMAKVKNKTNRSNPKRAEIIEKFGFDTKFAYHICRLLLEVEQIMMTGDVILDNNAKMLKSIREGEWTLEQIEKWADDKEADLEKFYVTSSLQHSPDEKKIKAVLMECIEMHYGSVSNSFMKDVGKEQLLADMQALVDKYK